MKTTLVLLLALSSLSACEFEAGEGGGGGYGEGGEGGGGSGGGSGGGGGNVTDTGGGGSSCNDANEGCGPNSCSGEGGSMLPGANCLGCHTGGEQGKFTAAGTVFTDSNGSGKSSGAIVTITDASGRSITLTTNSVGNFYTTQSLTFPITAEVEQGGFTSAMSSEVTTGACNTCHQCGGTAGGKLYSE